MRSWRFPTSAARRGSPRPAWSSPTCRPPSTITGPRRWWPVRTAASCMSASAPTATSPRTAWIRSTGARTCWRWTWPAPAAASTPPACATRPGCSSNRIPASCGRSSTSVTRSVPDLVLDYLTSVQEGGFYGWPYSYYGQHVDSRVMPQRPDLVAKAIKPDYALGSHVAALGLLFSDTNALPAEYQHGAFVGEHGSWDRSPLSGYAVVHVAFVQGERRRARDGGQRFPLGRRIGVVRRAGGTGAGQGRRPADRRRRGRCGLAGHLRQPAGNACASASHIGAGSRRIGSWLDSHDPVMPGGRRTPAAPHGDSFTMTTCPAPRRRWPSPRRCARTTAGRRRSTGSSGS
ncbi:hypothetical protein RLIN73S_06236 [Rhodanobacter lindaniclasticus]